MARSTIEGLEEAAAGRTVGSRDHRVGFRAAGSSTAAEHAAAVANVISFNAAISGCNKGVQWQRVAALLNEMRSVVSGSVLQPCLIQQCGQWQRVAPLLDAMCSRGLSHNVISFSAAISACDKGVEWQHLVPMLDHLRSLAIFVWQKCWQRQRLAPLIDEICSRCLLPNVISFSTAISACEIGAQWQRVAPVLDQFPSRQRVAPLLNEICSRCLLPSVISFSAAISACKK
eukprot:6073106-Karenia_brevis.AAC.1